MPLILIFLIATTNNFAHASNFTLRDIGVIGLFSHDIFTWDHENKVNTENGRIDLSTIFDYQNGSQWRSGGNPKNSENAPVFTITMQLVNYYKKQLVLSHNKIKARQLTVRLFQNMVHESYTRVFQFAPPAKNLKALPSNTEQAALRALHDILPGKIKLYFRGRRKTLTLTNFFTAKTMLNENELNQYIKPFDGDYDHEYKSIKIPFSKKTINLKQIDKNFIEEFSNYQQTEMLLELAQVGQKNKQIADVNFIQHIYDLYAKAFCAEGNKWMPQEKDCL